MSEKSKQNISELMDGELSNDCSRFLLKRMQADSTLQSTWNHYHLLRSSLQQENDTPLMENLGASVISHLKKEAVAQEQSASGNSWLKAIAGSAIAASVAWVAVLTFNQNQLNDSIAVDGQPVYAKTSQQFINPPNASMVRVEQPVRYTRFPSLTPQIQQYLTDSNNPPQIPVYYNAEYINSVLIQSNQQPVQVTAEE